MNRRKTLHPTTIIKSIVEKRLKPKTARMPAPLKWGLDKEIVAIDQYQSLASCRKVEQCGFVINPEWPWLGCSPEGVVVEEGGVVGCVEVKCPYAKKDANLKAEAQSDEAFFLRNVDNKLALKTNRNYYYQCQGVMNILEMPWIDFIVYTTIDLHMERIFRDNLL